MDAYVHGYQTNENERLQNQARTLTDLLHFDTVYPAGHTVLEAGCGVGAQTVMLAARSPAARFTSIDINPQSIDAAQQKIHANGLVVGCSDCLVQLQVERGVGQRVRALVALDVSLDVGGYNI